MILIQKFFDLFKSNYSEYTLHETKVEKKPIYKQVEDTQYSKGLGISDPLDVKQVFVGFVDIQVEVWVSYNKKTGLPKYKNIIKE
jgi:hypothetical protein